MTLQELKNDMDKAYEDFDIFSKELIEKFKESKRKFANYSDKQNLDKLKKMKDDYFLKKAIYKEFNEKVFAFSFSVFKDALQEHRQERAGA